MKLKMTQTYRKALERKKPVYEVINDAEEPEVDETIVEWLYHDGTGKLVRTEIERA